MGAFSRVRFLGQSPLTCIELIIAISAVVGGLYVMSPFLVVNVSLTQAPSLVQNLASYTGIIILGLAAVLNGLVMLWGIFRRNYAIRSLGLFTNILLRLYVIIATIAAQGFFPMTWLSSLTIMGIAVICWLHVRGQIRLFRLNE